MSSIEKEGTRASIESREIRKKSLSRRKKKEVKKNTTKGKMGSESEKRRRKCCEIGKKRRMSGVKSESSSARQIEWPSYNSKEISLTDSIP